jgi:hypothetical protein
MALLHRDPEISLTEPVPLIPAAPPQPLRKPQPGSDRYGEELDATLLLVDARMGQDDIAVGETAALRIFEDVPRKSVPDGQVIPVSATSMYTVKRVIGTVPVEEDGSAFFRVPANRPLYFSILDSNGLEIQRMRSSLCLKPGEVQACLGCHESRHLTPPNGSGLPMAARGEPVEPRKPAWGWMTFSYLRDVQPVLDRNCLPCHARSRKENAILLTSELTDQYALSYEELLPFIKTAYAMRWDVPYDVERLPPRDFGSGASELMSILRAGHYGVKLSPEDMEVLGTWIDCNGVYYGWYEQAWSDRRIMTEPWKSQILDINARRCSGCHSDRGMVGSIPWPLMCVEEPLASSPLLAPLSVSAGGWGSCGEVFEKREDPDWRRLRLAFEQLGRALKDHPRQDLRELADRE